MEATVDDDEHYGDVFGGGADAPALEEWSAQQDESQNKPSSLGLSLCKAYDAFTINKKSLLVSK